MANFLLINDKNPPSGGWRGEVSFSCNPWRQRFGSRLYSVILDPQPMPYIVHLGIGHMTLHCSMNNASAICPIVKYSDLILCKTR